MLSLSNLFRGNNEIQFEFLEISLFIPPEPFVSADWRRRINRKITNWQRMYEEKEEKPHEHTNHPKDGTYSRRRNSQCYLLFYSICADNISHISNLFFHYFPTARTACRYKTSKNTFRHDTMKSPIGKNLPYDVKEFSTSQNFHEVFSLCLSHFFFFTRLSRLSHWTPATLFRSLDVLSVFLSLFTAWQFVVYSKMISGR